MPPEPELSPEREQPPERKLPPEPFESWPPPTAIVPAPDGSSVWPLGVLAGAASLARFELPAGAVSRAVSHATVQELWHVVAGTGRIWRRQGDRTEVVELAVGSTVSIPLGTAFQFRADGDGPLLVVAATVPPWPGTQTEARPETGPWQPTVHGDAGAG
ncbi:cupin domain-containing protein [Kitasatospora sp. LaBMicrA B282]|uniref:cupin domain-containing protein n=1 Tax=Kitasatospora sp. LaBMicrA B282 TaxID=3420949 RepID=UPI003D0BC49D